MNIRLLATTSVVCLFASSMFAQHRVNPRNMYERVMAVVPMIGKGTLSDPIRPMYAPSRNAINPASRTGIIAFTYVPSDDGKFALAEFVARDSSAFKDILDDKTIKAFLKGKDKRQDIETEFKKHKKDFSFEHFGVVVP